MPLIGYACPPGSPTHGERHEVAHCLGDCPHPCVSPPLLNALYKAENENHHQGAYISASMLTGGLCARKVYYERFEDFFEYPGNRWWAFRGTLSHALIEGAGAGVAPYGWMQELRMGVDLEYPDLPQPIFATDGSWTGDFLDEPLRIRLGGTTDAYNPLTRTLHDFKSAADAKVQMMVLGEKGDDNEFSRQLEDKWVWQTNIYRWLISKTPISPELRERYGLEGEYLPAPETLVIQTFSMMMLVRSGYDVEVRLPPKGNQRWGKKEILHVDPVPVLPLDTIENYVRPRALEWYRYLVLRERPPIVDKKNSWLCKTCCFNGHVVAGERCLPETERRHAA